MKTKLFLFSLTLLLLVVPAARAQSSDAAIDARPDAPVVLDAATTTDAGKGGSGGSRDAGAHDAAPLPPIHFYFNESPGCSVGGGEWQASSLLGLALTVFTLARRRGAARSIRS